MSVPRDPLDPAQLDALLERAECEPEASRELDFLADLVATVEREQRHLGATPAWPGRLRRAHLFAAAATLLFVLGFGAWLLQRERGPSARLAWNTPPLFVATELRGPAPLAEEFALAMEPYSRAAWSEARAALEGFRVRHPTHAPARFYLAVVLAELGLLEPAREHYRAVAACDEPLLAEHARFRLALLELGGAADAAARAELIALAAGAGPFAAAARELLDGPSR